MARMDKVIVARCFEKKELLTSWVHLVRVPRVGDYLTIPGREEVLEVQALEWQVEGAEVEVTNLHIYGTLMRRPYRI